MDSSQGNTYDPANPTTTTTDYDDTNPPKEKLSFADRHKAPTTKDVESNNWVFGSGQAATRPGDRRAAADAAAGEDAPGNNFSSGTAGMGSGMGRERYGDDGIGSGTGAGSGMMGGRDTDYEGTRQQQSGGGVVGSTTGVYEGTTGYEGSTGTGMGRRDDNTTGTGTGMDNEDDYEDDGAGGKKKKMNPLKKVVEAVKNI